MKKKQLSVLVASSLLVLVLATLSLTAACAAPEATPTPGTPTPGEKFSWKLQSDFPPGCIEHDMLSQFAARIYEKSEGRLEIEIFSGGSIAPWAELLPALTQGVVDFMITSGGYYEGIIPVTALEGGLPAQNRGWDTLEEVEALFDAGLEDLFREAYATQNTYYVGWLSVHAYPCFMSTIPVRSLEDWDGVKVRAWGPWLAILTKLGAGGVFIPGGEIYMAMKLGTIDVATWTVDAIRGMKLYEIMDYLIMPPLSDHMISMGGVNMDAWEALPDDIKRVVDESYEVYAQLVYTVYCEEWNSVVELSDALGYEVITFSDADVEVYEQLSMEVWDDYAAKGPELAKGIQIMKDFYGIK